MIYIYIYTYIHTYIMTCTDFLHIEVSFFVVPKQHVYRVYCDPSTNQPALIHELWTTDAPMNCPSVSRFTIPVLRSSIYPP